MNDTVNLDGIRYLPIIRSRQAELKAYAELRAETKRSLIPLVALGKHHRVDDPERVVEKVSDAVPGRFFLDLNQTPDQSCHGCEALASEDDNFAAWRGFVGRVANAIPVALISHAGTRRQIVRQVMLLEDASGIVAVRSKNPLGDLPDIQAMLSAVDDVENLLIVLDFGYIRGTLEQREQEARAVVTSLREIDGRSRIVVAASSYPRSVTPYGETGGSLEIVERQLHERLGGDQVAIYGDHASIYPEPFAPGISRFVPRIDYPTPTHWVYRRRRDGPRSLTNSEVVSGFVKCAEEIVGLPEWVPEDERRIWGSGVIAQTARESTIAPSGFRAPANWIAVRANIHMEKQSDYETEDDFVLDEDDF